MKKAYKFDFQKGEFVFESKDAVVLTGYDALKQRIEKCIRTQLNRYTMYNGTGYQERRCYQSVLRHKRGVFTV